MEVKEIRVNYGLTINLGNYENEKIEVGVTVALLPGESEEEVVNKFTAWAKAKCYQVRHTLKGQPEGASQPKPLPRRF